MSYDIYGEVLSRGHCEVHPWVHEEYPCSLCFADNEKYRKQNQQEKKYYEQMEREYAESIERDYQDYLWRRTIQLRAYMFYRFICTF
jgi:hypothetical protein